MDGSTFVRVPAHIALRAFIVRRGDGGRWILVNVAARAQPAR